MNAESEVRARRFGYAILAAVFVALTWPIQVFNLQSANGVATDERAYHLPTIRQFAAQLPFPDVTDYPSATGPGYHLIMAVVARAWDEPRFLRIVGGFFALGVVLAFYGFTARRTDARRALALAAPLLFLYSTIRCGIWLLTDYAALLYAMLALGMLWLGPLRSWRAVLLCGVLAAASVSIRQIGLWIVAPMVVAMAWERWQGVDRHGGGQPRAGETPTPPLMCYLVAVALPFVVVGGLMLAWGGATPPQFQAKHSVWSLSAIPIGMGVAGWVAVWMLPLAWRHRHLSRWNSPALWLALGAVLAAALLSHTNFEVKAGRFGGPLWNVTDKMRSLGPWSPVFPGLALLACVALAPMLGAARAAGNGRQAAILAAAWIALLVAHTANKMMFQRYFEPYAIILLGWLAVSTFRGADDAARGRWWIGPVAFAAVQAVFLVYREYGPFMRNYF